MKVAIIGAGWAGCAAAVEATRQGHSVTIFEAARIAGGRARRLDVVMNEKSIALDNGQHILIGAYSESLKLMAQLGVNLTDTLHRMPLTLQFPDGSGLKLPNLPAPFDAFVGILRSSGWSWAEKFSLLKTAAHWQLQKFQCPPQLSVTDLCREVSPRIMTTLIEPLCVSALNTPVEQASGTVFLRVLKDSLFAHKGGSNLLLPRVDLSSLMPDAALGWLASQGGQINLGCRVSRIVQYNANSWCLTDATEAALGQFEAVILACPPNEAARLVYSTTLPCADWTALAEGLRYEAIATVYAHAPGAYLSQPMLVLPSNSVQPAQFVFDRGHLGGPPGLLAFVVSTSQQSSAELAAQVKVQASKQLGLQNMQVLQTVVEKRATFACTPGLLRPPARICTGLLACGDYVEGPYPATLEGAVRSGLYAARLLEK